MTKTMKASVAIVAGVASLALLAGCTSPTSTNESDGSTDEPPNDPGQTYLAPSVEQAPAPPQLKLADDRAKLG